MALFVGPVPWGLRSNLLAAQPGAGFHYAFAAGGAPAHQGILTVTLAGIDVVVGAKGSPMQLIL